MRIAQSLINASDSSRHGRADPKPMTLAAQCRSQPPADDLKVIIIARSAIARNYFVEQLNLRLPVSVVAVESPTLAAEQLSASCRAVAIVPEDAFAEAELGSLSGRLVAFLRLFPSERYQQGRLGHQIQSVVSFIETILYGTSSIRKYGDLTLNILRSEVQVGAQAPIQLRPLVFNILQLLTEYCHTLVATDAIYRRVWPHPEHMPVGPTEKNVVYRHISELRHDLQRAAGDGYDYVNTVEKQGYQFCVRGDSLAADGRLTKW